MLHKAEAPVFKGFIKGSERLNLWFGMMDRVCVSMCECVRERESVLGFERKESWIPRDSERARLRNGFT